MTLAYIIYDSGDGIIIYKANLTDEELVKVREVHNKLGNIVGTTHEQDAFLMDIDSQIGDIERVFDETDVELCEPITTEAGALVFVTGFSP